LSVIVPVRIAQAAGRRWHALVLAACFLLLLHHAAGAHAIILSSVPPAGGVVKGSDVSVELHFNSRIDRQRSKLLVISADGKEVPVPLGDKSTDDTLIGQAQGIAPGDYRLRWQVLSVDGHITRGDIAFRVVAP
jgi:methionine-rich copper-binding protein CopC